MSDGQALDLSGNNLTGALPDAWGEAGAFPVLKMLLLQSNELGGELPEAWGYDKQGLPDLQVLDLSANGLVGELPQSWANGGSMNTLAVLHLENNQLTGSLPATWAAAGAWPSLQYLNLQQNSIGGTLPLSWADPAALPALTQLSLGSNMFAGLDLQRWSTNGSFQQLQSLDLSYNAFFGNLPSGLGSNGSFPRLRDLNLEGNLLDGSLPEGWGMGNSFPALNNLSLIWNRLSGSLPDSWLSFSAGPSIWLRPGNYQLCGSLPENNGTSLQFCEDINGTCTPLNNLGPICALYPRTHAPNLPPTASNTTLLAVLRVTATDLTPSANLSLAAVSTLQALLTSATPYSVNVVLLADVNTSASPFAPAFPGTSPPAESPSTGRRLLGALEHWAPGRRLAQASLSSVDVVMRMTVRN